MQRLELVGCNLVEEVSELALPLLAVTEDGKLERLAVQQHKLDVDYCLHALHIVDHLRVPVTRRK